MVCLADRGVLGRERDAPCAAVGWAWALEAVTGSFVRVGRGERGVWGMWGVASW